MASFCPTMAFSSVDLPALGRPRMATNPAWCVMGGTSFRNWRHAAEDAGTSLGNGSGQAAALIPSVTGRAFVPSSASYELDQPGPGAASSLHTDASLGRGFRDAHLVDAQIICG